MQIKNFLKTKRENLNLNQLEASKKIGISQSFLADIERGFRLPSDVAAEKIMNAYNLTEDEKKYFKLNLGLEKSPDLIIKAFREQEQEIEQLKKEIESLKTQNIEIKTKPETKEEMPPEIESPSIPDEEIKELFETMTQNEKGAVKYHYVEDDMYNKKVTFENYAKEYIKKNPVLFQERRKKQLKYELQYKKAEENYKTMSVELKSQFEKDYLELTNNEQKKYKSKKQYLIERYRKDFYGENTVDIEN